MQQNDHLRLLMTEVERIIGIESVTPEVAIGELGFDSLNIVELILACEQIYGAVDLENLKLERFTSLAELDAQIAALTAQAGTVDATS
jgi:acyl carrier protein